MNPELLPIGVIGFAVQWAIDLNMQKKHNLGEYGNESKDYYPPALIIPLILILAGTLATLAEGGDKIAMVNSAFVWGMVAYTSGKGIRDAIQYFKK